jgi:hypothetical protein
MNPMKDGIPNPTKENVREIRHVYLDLDEDAGASLHALRTSGDVPSPKAVLDTSPGKHQVVWHVEGFDQEQAESLLRSLANQFGGDLAATDVSRVLHLPGFTNRKYNEQFIIRVHHELDQVYHLGDFRVQEDSPDAPSHLADPHEPTRKLPSGHRSQSEATGRVPSGLSPAVTTLNKSSGASPTTARTTRQTRPTMRASP